MVCSIRCLWGVGGVGGYMYVHMDILGFICLHMHAEAQRYTLKSCSMTLYIIFETEPLTKPEIANSGSFGQLVCSGEPFLHCLHARMSQPPSLLSFYMNAGDLNSRPNVYMSSVFFIELFPNPASVFLKCLVADYYWIWMTERMIFKVQVLEAIINWRATRDKNKISPESLSKSIVELVNVFKTLWITLKKKQNVI